MANSNITLVGDLTGKKLRTRQNTEGGIKLEDIVVVVGGDVASGGADSGNPVKVGGVYNATPPTLNDGEQEFRKLCQWIKEW